LIWKEFSDENSKGSMCGCMILELRRPMCVSIFAMEAYDMNNVQKTIL
jgi:hypothetical protein